jgi:hypothetical protein
MKRKTDAPNSELEDLSAAIFARLLAAEVSPKRHGWKPPWMPASALTATVPPCYDIRAACVPSLRVIHLSVDALLPPVDPDGPEELEWVNLFAAVITDPPFRNLNAEYSWGGRCALLNWHKEGHWQEDIRRAALNPKLPADVPQLFTELLRNIEAFRLYHSVEAKSARSARPIDV